MYIKIKPIEAIKTILWKRKQKKEGTYPYSGLEIFMGRQGGGKTLSASELIKRRLDEYPRCMFITNTEIKGIENETKYFKDSQELVELLKNELVAEKREGYLIFIDEIHVVLAELFGKTDPIFLTFLSQQRKLSINIIGTSQMYNKLPRVIRDYLRQSGEIILCSNAFKILQINRRLNMENVTEDSKNNLDYSGCTWEIFTHTRELYESYNTFSVITQIQGLLKQNLRNLDSLGQERKEIGLNGE